MCEKSVIIRLSIYIFRTASPHVLSFFTFLAHFASITSIKECRVVVKFYLAEERVELIRSYGSLFILYYK